ncbi:MAG TPA: hypothetical protein IAB02_07570 [Candidatus Pullichristensenella excrementigallinarum]|uniref:Uncharacterized protein n=1 Tax=Candidatus Pullichristensenella excrementigallinarum TaxID=2840907 RepID=A0A9D1LD73_9FIRM|nr:hypothetical protein [Candidatus Pullichristensenella excrementigallinarum]
MDAARSSNRDSHAVGDGSGATEGSGEGDASGSDPLSGEGFAEGDASGEREGLTGAGDSEGTPASGAVEGAAEGRGFSESAPDGGALSDADEVGAPEEFPAAGVEIGPGAGVDSIGFSGFESEGSGVSSASVYPARNPGADGSAAVRTNSARAQRKAFFKCI